MKNKIYIILLAIVCSVSFLSCKKDKEEKPVADFTYIYIDQGGVQLTPNGKGDYTWNFGGDGKQQGTSNPAVFYYKQNGTYTVKLTASLNGETVNKETIITITGVPTKISITNITLLQYRDNNNSNNPWDNDATGPDIKFQYTSVRNNN